MSKPSDIALIHCPAKINIFLHVTGKRDDGYHDLSTLMVPLDFGDDLQLDFSGKGIRVFCDHPDVPEDDSNLAYRAAALFYEQGKSLGLKSPPGVDIHIKKRIPVGGGLGRSFPGR